MHWTPLAMGCNASERPYAGRPAPFRLPTLCSARRQANGFGSIAPPMAAFRPALAKNERQMITGEQVKAARKLLGWSQLELAYRAQAPQSLICTFEKSGAPQRKRGLRPLGKR
jgi:ribosome-binding protein aMBF1 (putative translation factor)